VPPQTLFRIAPTPPVKTIVLSNIRIVLLCHLSFYLYEWNPILKMELMEQTSFKVDHNFCCAGISSIGNNIDVSSQDSTVRFFNGRGFSRSRMNLQLLPPSVKSREINISHNNKWVLITTSYVLFIFGCNY